MNNRQAGAHREMIRKEERAREVWERQWAGAAASDEYDQNQNQGQAPDTYVPQQTQDRAPIQIDDLPSSRAAYDPNAASIYDRAIRISSPRMADDGGDDVAQTVDKKVLRQVEVPFTRKVKVPVKTRKIVPTKVQKKVRTKKLVEVPSFKMVDETYTEILEEPAVRNKEIWVKKVVPERYMKKVPVTKTRKVKVPTTEIQEVDDFEIVQVSGSKAIEVDGFRVDEVEDSKLVEVEEYQTYEMRPFAAGPAKVVGTRDIGPVRSMHHSRKIGNEVYHVQDAVHRDIDVDSTPDDAAMTRSFGNSRSVKGLPAMGTRSGRRQHQPRDTYGTNTYSERMGNAAATGRIGMKLRNTQQQNGVLVPTVLPGEAAERAGVLASDIITHVNNQPTRTLEEFRSVVGSVVGPLHIQVTRRGVRKLRLTITR